MGRAAFWCWYRGEAFAGFQRQAGLRTVQDEVLKAFEAAGMPRNPVVAGRTDRGVSARMQVLSARVTPHADLDAMPAAINAFLPDDVRVHLVAPTGEAFHAAFSATSKEYRYALSADDTGDLARLREAAALVPGTRDFRVFHFKTSAVRPRTVQRVDVLDGPPETPVVLRFVGDGFARYMVRMLTGALTAVARGEVPIDVFREGLEAQRNFGCPKAPAGPLTLWEVCYPPALDPFTAAQREAFAWPPLG